MVRSPPLASATRTASSPPVNARSIGSGTRIVVVSRGRRAGIQVQRAAAGGLEAVLVCPTAVTGPFDFHGSEAGRGIRYNMRPGLKFTVDGAYDFVDVRDVAAGFILAAERGRPGRTYILGGERLTVRQVAQIVWETAQCPCPNVQIPLWLAYLAAGFLQPIADFFDVEPLVTRYSLDAVTSNAHISHARAAEELGYRPRPAGEAIRDAVRWFQEMDRSVVVESPAKAAV